MQNINVNLYRYKPDLYHIKGYITLYPSAEQKENLYNLVNETAIDKHIAV